MRCSMKWVEAHLSSNISHQYFFAFLAFPQITDRYYKLGSSVDITCQVALSFLNTIPSPTITSSDKVSTTSTTTTTTTTTTIFPFIDTNLIKRPIERIPYNGKHNIVWKKDGKELPKDIKINLRFVWWRDRAIYFLWHLFDDEHGAGFVVVVTEI